MSERDPSPSFRGDRAVPLGPVAGAPRPRDDREADDAHAADAHAVDAGRRAGIDPLFQVRTADIEPYTGLRYLSKLFRVIALMLVLMLVAEVVTGLARQGTDAIPTLVSEASRLIVLAGLLWGIGDLAILLIDVGHDVRAARVLLGRVASHVVHGPAPATREGVGVVGEPGGERGEGRAPGERGE